MHVANTAKISNPSWSGKKEFIGEVAKRLDIKMWTDWYKFSRKDVVRLGGSQYLQEYQDSYSKMIMSLIPDHPWKFSDFNQRVPHNFWSFESNKRDFMKNLEQNLNISSWKDWYKVTRSDIQRLGGESLIRRFYDDSPPKLIMAMFPEHPWNPRKFRSVPKDYWSKESNRKDFMKILEKKMKILEWEDWYQISSRDIEEAGGATLLRKYNHSPPKLIMSLLPEHNWDIHEFSRTPANYWSLESNQIAFMQRLEKKLNVQRWEDWYLVSQKDIMQEGGSSLLQLYYDNSPSKLITTLYPQHPWDLSEFNYVPRNYWSLESNRKAFMKSLEKKLMISDWKDWYKVTADDISNAGGGTLLREFFNGSPSKLIMTLCPGHPWNLTEFSSVPMHHWTKESNRREFMTRLEAKMKISDWTDWYNVTAKDIQQIAGGGTLLASYYNFSPSTLITSMYPQHPWSRYEFRSKFTWDQQLIQSFLSQISSSLGLDSPNTWRTLSGVQLKNFRGGRSLLRQKGTLSNALKIAYPQEDWDFIRTIKISKPQYKIVDILCKYLPRNLIHVNYRHDLLVHKSGVKAELDIWVPSLNLAVEYHGEHHFHQLWERSQDPMIRVERDAEKRLLCAERDIKLVEIPYWWDNSEEQLMGIIRYVKPEFLKEVGIFKDILPIRHNLIPQKRNILIFWHRGVEYSFLHDSVAGWYAAEKLDGIRCYWDGANVFSRGSHPINLFKPLEQSFKNAIDGELWYGRRLRFGIGLDRYPDLLAFDALPFDIVK